MKEVKFCVLEDTDVKIIAFSKSKEYLLVMNTDQQYLLIKSDTYLHDQLLKFYLLDDVDVAIYKRSDLDYFLSCVIYVR